MFAVRTSFISGKTDMRREFTAKSVSDLLRFTSELGPGRLGQSEPSIDGLCWTLRNYQSGSFLLCISHPIAVVEQIRRYMCDVVGIRFTTFDVIHQLSYCTYTEHRTIHDVAALRTVAERRGLIFFAEKDNRVFFHYGSSDILVQFNKSGNVIVFGCVELLDGGGGRGRNGGDGGRDGDNRDRGCGRSFGDLDRILRDIADTIEVDTINHVSMWQFLRMYRSHNNSSTNSDTV